MFIDSIIAEEEAYFEMDSDNEDGEEDDIIQGTLTFLVWFFL